MKNFFLRIAATLALLSIGISSLANSYIYIQGDKKTSIYVKVEGQMMPRLGLHYNIIPNLGAGDTRIEILFQENKYPPHYFVIRVPDNGARGFILTPVNDKQFALYDLQSKMYIPNGNKQDDAYVVAVMPSDSYFTKPKSETPKQEIINQTEGPIISDKFEEAEKPASRFLDEVDLDVKRTTNKPKKSTKNSTKTLNNQGIVKSEEPSQPIEKTVTAPVKCYVAIPTHNFEDFAGKLYAFNDDESKLKYLRKNASKHCFDTQQAGILAGLVNGQSSRFETLQILFPKIVDPDNYYKLEALFSTDFMKDKFNSMIAQ